MKIAYLILAHNDPKQLNKLIESLYVDNITYFFIHIDKKQDISPFIFNKKNVIYIKKRIYINWGGYSICEAEKMLLQESLNYNIIFNRFILLSGLDYPIWSNKKMINEYENNPQKIYMKAYNLSKVSTPSKIPQRICTYHFRDLKIENRLLRRCIVGGLMHIMNYVPIKKNNYIKVNNERWDIWGGSQWFNIPRECALFLLNALNNEGICNYFKTSFAPDELMVQTIIFNSKFKIYAEPLEENGIYPGLEKTTMTHYIEYNKGQKIFNEEDFNKLISSNKMFCRKLRTGISDKLIEKIKSYRNDKI